MSAYNISGWIPFSPGTIIRNVGGRHIGRVESVRNSVFITVRWENGWLEQDIEVDDLERAFEVIK